MQHDGLQQEEADAVAALLAAASGLSSEDMNASTPYPSGVPPPHLSLFETAKHSRPA